MSVKLAKKLERNGLNHDKKGPQKIKIFLRRILKRRTRKKIGKKKRKSTGRKKKKLSRNIYIKNIH